MNAEKLFYDYADGFDRDNSKIALKILHTMKVAEVSDDLCCRLGLDDHITKLAHICAVFHDIGRLEQITKYDTFDDRISIDHGELSCRILQEQHMLDELPENEQKMVLTAIYNHNKFRIEEGLDDITLLLCKLIRDSDKCDIHRVFATEDPVDTMGESAEQVRREKISDDVYEQFMARRCIPKSIRKAGIDYWVGFLAFYYDLYFPESVKIMAENDYCRSVFRNTEFVLPETKLRIETMLADLQNYIDTLN